MNAVIEDINEKGMEPISRATVYTPMETNCQNS